MRKTTGALSGALLLSTVAVTQYVGTASAEDPPPDPEVVAGREQAANGTSAVGQAPPSVTTSGAIGRQSTMQAGNGAPGSEREMTGPGTRGVNNYFYYRGISRSAGYVETYADDYVKNDNPGYLTTTVRIWGSGYGARSGEGYIKNTMKFTCSGTGIGSLSVGGGGWSVSGGSTSSTLTWDAVRGSGYSKVRQVYDGDGHFRCKASNATPAKTTHRGTALAKYKNVDTRAEDAYSFWW